MPPKQGAGQRRVSSSLSKASGPAPSEKASKPTKPSHMIKFKLPKVRLLQFPHESSPSKSVPKKKSPLSKSTLAAPPDPPSQQGTHSESLETPMPATTKSEPSSSEGTVKNEPSSPKAGDKRPHGTGVEEPKKERARPGPKKKPRA